MVGACRVVGVEGVLLASTHARDPLALRLLSGVQGRIRVLRVVRCTSSIVSLTLKSGCDWPDGRIHKVDVKLG